MLLGGMLCHTWGRRVGRNMTVEELAEVLQLVAWEEVGLNALRCALRPDLPQSFVDAGAVVTTLVYPSPRSGSNLRGPGRRSHPNIAIFGLWRWCCGDRHIESQSLFKSRHSTRNPAQSNSTTPGSKAFILT